MKLSGDTKITIKVPKRLYEQIKRQLNEESLKEDNYDSKKEDWIDRVNTELNDTEISHWFEGETAKIPKTAIGKDLEKIMNQYPEDPDTAAEEIKKVYSEKDQYTTDESEEKVTMEELFEAVKKIKADKKKKMAEAKKKPLTKAEIAKAKKAEEANLVKEKEAKKKMAETKKK